MAIYARIKGNKQGAITGGVAAAGFKGQIQINTCEFGVGSPFDLATGQSTGKRVARPLHLVKPVDQSSPLLFTSCVNNETLTVDIAYMVEGQGHQEYMTLSLTNAMIRDFNHLGSFDGTAIEKISLTYSKFEFTWINPSIMAVDDWTGSS